MHVALRRAALHVALHAAAFYHRRDSGVHRRSEGRGSRGARCTLSAVVAAPACAVVVAQALAPSVARARKFCDEHPPRRLLPEDLRGVQGAHAGGAAISIGCIFFALLLFAAEFSSYRAIETTDRLAVDTSTPSDGKLDINLDIYFPSLPCAELLTGAVDESGSQQLAVTDTLHKLRVDRNGVPIDIPRPSTGGRRWRRRSASARPSR